MLDPVRLRSCGTTSVESTASPDQFPKPLDIWNARSKTVFTRERSGLLLGEHTVSDPTGTGAVLLAECHGIRRFVRRID